jgi:uncharacterized protein YgiM (DUF1202 family)
MKTNCWLVLGTMIATGALAQVSTNKLPEIPPPATSPAVAPAPAALELATNTAAPVKKKAAAHKKKAVKKIAEPIVTLVPGVSTVASDNLNLRGQAGLKGEVIGHVKKGDSVMVISQINLDKHAADEPAQWAKIALPAGIKVWVNSKFVDATNKVVSVKKLNLRAGPGENYSVLGVLEKGAPISEVGVKGDWTQIETPTNAFAFVAAIFLKQEPVVAPATVETPVAPVAPVVVPPPTTNTVTEAQLVVTQPASAPTPVVETPAPVASPVAAVAPAVETNAPAIVETNLPPPPPRVVTHEGYVRSSISPVAPTPFELYDNESGNAVNYLYSTTTNLNLARYNSMRIIVTGEEGLTARWQDTPVLTVQRIYVVSTNPPVVQRVTSPRASQRH